MNYGFLHYGVFFDAALTAWFYTLGEVRIGPFNTYTDAIADAKEKGVWSLLG